MVVQMGHQYGPLAPTVAPGQLISLVVHGIGANLTSNVVATSKPLPTELAGISIILHQLTQFRNVPVPIYSVEPLPACDWNGNSPPFLPLCGTVAGITIQVPFELDTLRFEVSSPAFFIYENGQFKADLSVGTSDHQVHIANTGDVQVQFPELQIGALYPVIRHLDKTFINEFNPAMPGETLSMWAVGLGQGVGAVQSATGQPAPQGVVVEPGIDFQWAAT